MQTIGVRLNACVGANMIDPAKRFGTRRAIAWGGLAGIVLATCLAVYVSANVRIVRLDNIYNPEYGYRVGRREEHFSNKFPTTQDIETYLFDSTLLVSNPPHQSVVRYFDREHNYISWHSNLIESGKWWSSPEWQLIRLGDRWRFATVQTFCTISLVFGVPETGRQDNCYSVETTSSLFSFGGTREHRSGDVFKLTGRQAAPFKIPDKPITIDSLLTLLPATGN